MLRAPRGVYTSYRCDGNSQDDKIHLRYPEPPLYRKGSTKVFLRER